MDSGTLCKPVVRNSLEQEKQSCLQGRVLLHKPATQGLLSGLIVVNKGNESSSFRTLDILDIVLMLHCESACSESYVTLQHVTFLLLSTPSDEIRLHSEHRRIKTRRPKNFSRRRPLLRVSFIHRFKWKMKSLCICVFNILCAFFFPVEALSSSCLAPSLTVVQGDEQPIRFPAGCMRTLNRDCTVYCMNTQQHSAATHLLTQS